MMMNTTGRSQYSTVVRKMCVTLPMPQSKNATKGNTHKVIGLHTSALKCSEVQIEEWPYVAGCHFYSLCSEPLYLLQTKDVCMILILIINLIQGGFLSLSIIIFYKRISYVLHVK